MCDCEKGRRSGDWDRDRDCDRHDRYYYHKYHDYDRRYDYGGYLDYDRDYHYDRRCNSYWEPRLSHRAYWPHYKVNPRYYAY